jgi:hypothetical protein
MANACTEPASAMCSSGGATRAADLRAVRERWSEMPCVGGWYRGMEMLAGRKGKRCHHYGLLASRRLEMTGEIVTVELVGQRYHRDQD